MFFFGPSPVEVYFYFSGLVLVTQSPHSTSLQCNPAAEPAGNTDFKIRDFLLRAETSSSGKCLCRVHVTSSCITAADFYYCHIMIVVITLFLCILFLLTITFSFRSKFSFVLPEPVNAEDTITCEVLLEFCFFLRGTYFIENSLICLIMTIYIFSLVAS